jgi:hypothetical protein
MSNKSNDKKPKKDDDNIGKQTANKELDSLHPFINKVPSNFREVFLAIQQTITRSSVHPLIEKFNEKHIDKALDQISVQGERQYELAKIDKRNNLVYVIIGSTIFVFLSWFLLPSDKEAFIELIRTLLVAGGGIGIGGGYTIVKLYRSRKM